MPYRSFDDSTHSYRLLADNKDDLYNRIAELEAEVERARQDNNPDSEDALLRQISRAYYNLNLSHHQMRDVERGLRYFQQALAAYQQSGNQKGEAAALTYIAWHYGYLDDVEQAVSYYQQAANVQHQLGDRRAEEVSLYNMAMTHYNYGGKVSEAIRLFQEAAAIEDELGGYQFVPCNAHEMLEIIAKEQGGE